MLTSLIVNLSGPDRPGLVKLVSDCAIQHEANWADSVMANFAGQFCGIVHLQVQSHKADALGAALNALSGPSLDIRTTQTTRSASEGEGLRLSMRLVGNDRPGITQAISSELAQLGVNILKLQSRIVSAPMSGENLFSMELDVVLPRSLEVEQLQAALEGIATELMVDLRLSNA